MSDLQHIIEILCKDIKDCEDYDTFEEIKKELKLLNDKFIELDARVTALRILN